MGFWSNMRKYSSWESYKEEKYREDMIEKMKEPSTEEKMDAAMDEAADAQQHFMEVFGERNTGRINTAGSLAIFVLSLWLLAGPLGVSVGASLVISLIVAGIAWFFVPYLLMMLLGLAVLAGIGWLIYIIW